MPKYQLPELLKKARILKNHEGSTYRWAPVRPLYFGRASSSHCVSAGSFIFGGRTNARGLQSILYTAYDQLDAGIEKLQEYINDREKNKKIMYTYDEVREIIKSQIYNYKLFSLYKIEYKFNKILDLTYAIKTYNDLQSLLHSHQLGETRYNSYAPCMANWPPGPPHNLSGGAAIGWYALKNGYEAILRPSYYIYDKWAISRPVLDILCPNVTKPMIWSRYKIKEDLWHKIQWSY